MNEPAAAEHPGIAPGKACGTCNLCCKLPLIDELAKPAGVWCSHCEIGRGCRIYPERPVGCRTFFCLWMHDPALGDEWKPTVCKFFLAFSPADNRMEIQCDPGYPLAWRHKRYRPMIDHWARQLRNNRQIVLVVAGKERTVVAPEGDFYLGKLEDGDQIQVAYDGSRLVRVMAVAPDGTEKRSVGPYTKAAN
jgi:hypothetical protein